MKTNRREFLIGAAAVAVVVPSMTIAMPKVADAGNWASVIEDYLTARGIAIDPMYLSKGGCRIGEFGMSYQKHVDVIPMPPSYEVPSLAQNHIEALAKAVLRQARWFRRSRVQFSNLWMPGRGVIDAAQYQSDRVHARELSCYDIFTDSVIKRVDVLYRFV